MNITTQRWTQERRIALQLASGHFILYICSYGMPIWKFYFVKFYFSFCYLHEKSDKEIFLAQLIGNLKCFYRRYLNSRVWIIPLHCKFLINEISKNKKTIRVNRALLYALAKAIFYYFYYLCENRALLDDFFQTLYVSK